MLPLIYSDRAYTLIFGIILVIWVTSELLGPVRWQGSSTTKKQDRGSLAIAISFSLLGLVLCFLLPFLLPSATIAQHHPSIFLVGFVVMLLGIWWRWSAIRALGRHFKGIVAVDPDQHIIQHGPYKLIRHPSYSGALLIMIGIGVMIGNWASLLTITLGLLGGLLYRISVEEAVLRSTFGQTYVDYMQRTKRLIPFIY